MTIGERYAIYFKPASSDLLSIFAAAVMGYEPEGTECRQFHSGLTSILGWQEITAEPRRYGFHATLKAPFRLADECSEQSLIESCTAFARERCGFEVDLEMGAIGNFVALKPRVENPLLNQLAAECVLHFDPFRAPLTERERERRRPHLLTHRQRQYLERYGYPYVLDEFRFHMTLTGPLDAQARQKIVPVLRALYEPLRRPIAVNSVAIFKQASAESQFFLLHRAGFRRP